MRGRLGLLTGALAALSLLPGDSSACATVLMLPVSLPEVSDENALVVWNSTTHVEDFVRSATFDTAVERFAFLVPTPSVPSLHEADPAALDEARWLLNDRRRVFTEYEPELGMLCMFGSRVKMKVRGSSSVVESLPGSVNELVHTHVAGMDATVVESDDPAAMVAWLTERGFVIRPPLERWIASYVERDYVFTAFQYERPPDAESITTRAVRMRFTTDRAFFPYSEPEDAPNQVARPFRLTFISDRPLRGELGSETISGPRLLRRRIDPATLTADELPENLAETLRFDGDAPLAWATIFRESASFRGADDLFFSPDTDEAEYVPIEVVHVTRRIPIPMDVVFVVLVVASATTVLVRRRRAARSA